MSCTDQDHAGHFCKAGNREQFQAVLIPVVDLGYTTPILNPDPSPLVTRNAARDCGDGRRCSWWWITVHARSVQRTGAVNGAPPPAFVPQVFPPLTQAEIQSSDGRTTSLKCRLTLSDSTDRQRTLVVDIGAGFFFGSIIGNMLGMKPGYVISAVCVGSLLSGLIYAYAT